MSLLGIKREKLYAYRDRHIKKIFSTERIDLDKFTYNARKMYEALGFSSDIEIIKCSSPLIACAVGAVTSSFYPKMIVHTSEVGPRLEETSEVGTRLEELFNEQFIGVLGSLEFRSAISLNQFYSQEVETLRSAVYDSILERSNSNLDNSHIINIINKIISPNLQLHKYVVDFNRQMVHYHDDLYHSVYIKYHKEILGMVAELQGIDAPEASMAYANCLEECFLFYPNNDFIVVSERPSFVDRDAIKNGGKIAEWDDGYNLYIYNGNFINVSNDEEFKSFISASNMMEVLS